jgi:hypothetical protein
MFVKNKDMRPHDYGDMSQVAQYAACCRVIVAARRLYTSGARVGFD